MFSLKRTAPVAFVVVAVGLIGSLASISAGWGWVGIVVSTTLALAVLVVCLCVLAPVLRRNERGVTLLEAVDSVGLVDIENRSDLTAPVSPHEFYEKAQDEIVITGISAYRTFDQHLEVLQRALRSGKKLYLLILHPSSRVLDNVSAIENKNVCADIQEVLRVISKAQLHEHAGFHIRFRDSLPPFTAIMIDGDLRATGETPRDISGQIRVQPSRSHSSQHGGIVLHLRKKEGKSLGGFDYFAEDLRRQWERDGRDDRTLFTQDRGVST